MDLRIEGADQLDAAARRLRAAGSAGKGLRKEMLAGIRAAAKPTVAAVKANTATLPQRGGLGRRLRTGIGVRTVTSGQRVGVRIVSRHKYSVNRINRGRLRHPVFGHRDRWATQNVRPGWFTDPIEKDIDQLRHAVVDAVERVARRVES